MLFFYFYKDQREKDAVLYYTLLFVFYVLLFLPRSLPVRPHLFSYLLITIFLYVLEFKPLRARWLLLPLAALWSNLHGVEYPVMLLLLGAYFVEFVCERMKKRGTPRKDTYLYAGLLVLAAAAVLCTPHGIRLLAVPFKSIAQVSPFVYELRPLSVYDFASFFGVLFFLAGLVAYSAIRKRSMRISHLLLFLGGLALLLKGKRFVNEYALLALPLLRAYIPAVSAGPRAKVLKPVAAALSVLFMAMPLFFMHSFFSHLPRYPVSARELPEGVAQFLKRVNGTGSILNHPNAGGYLEWELYPRWRIFMDMQVPFLFTAEDFETVRSAYTDPRVLREVIARYRPAFIAVPIEMDGFRALIANHPQYRLVFFDDAEVLYADGSQEPALALRYGMKSIDPFSLYSEPVRSSPDYQLVLKELLRLSELYPDGALVNAAIATVYQRQGRYREAMPYAESIMRTYPESHLGYKLKANLFSRLGACVEAAPFYKKAIDRSDGAMKELIVKEASACRDNPDGTR
jgi:tetratricopeptide (TPR) repeat protein